MQIKVEQNKIITEPLKKEMVYQSLAQSYNEIYYLYYDKENWEWTNEQMRRLYFALHKLLVVMQSQGDMEYQLNDVDFQM